MEKCLYLSAVEIFIFNQSGKKILLLKRAANRRVHPGLVAGVGGKMDCPFGKVETPLETAIREIEEETGILNTDISDIRLAGITTADDRFGKWLIFQFIAKLKSDSVKFRDTDEGELFWADTDSISSLNLIPDLKNGILQSYISDTSFKWIKSEFNENDEITSLSN